MLALMRLWTCSEAVRQGWFAAKGHAWLERKRGRSGPAGRWRRAEGWPVPGDVRSARRWKLMVDS